MRAGGYLPVFLILGGGGYVILVLDLIIAGYSSFSLIGYLISFAYASFASYSFGLVGANLGLGTVLGIGGLNTLFTTYLCYC